MIRQLVLVAAVVLGSGVADDGARAVLGRTKTTTAVYASYDWMVGRDADGVENDMWVAEFHSGDLYRGESPEMRAVVNCRTHVGYFLNVSSGEVKRDDDLWIGDCGISTAGEIETVIRLPSMSKSAFGPLDVLKVTDATRVRYYQVDGRGVIIRSNWTQRNGAAYPCVQAEPIARLNTLPSGEIFTKESLAVSIVASKYRGPPADLPDVGLSGKGCGEHI